MADNEDRNEKTSRGNEWEVVSLTASTYAAAPGPDEVELKDDDKELEGKQYFDEEVNKLFVHGKHETAIGDVTAHGESIAESNTLELAEQGPNFCPDLSQSKSASKDDNNSPPHLPCGAWWKRRASSLYAHAKEANTFWSVFVAATVVGLVMLGQRWQQERALQLKWQISVNDEVRSRVLAPLFRLKDVIVRGHRRGPLIRGSSSVEG
ncbi:hypothetical protein Lalb_Chr11g0072911 [Lupinus albus]|uniref:Uncharacterized protein n=1 Tax=Lupinus albus TaxID=3870 RepID=A0A6A4PSP2_LUPAL|nr:hypothetical protein Lalb_Chr11g0072911 [Lupinus albus]